ncbi:hypothetical protein [Paraburkholderia sp.]|uniref:hypothetical protein n=1 Tax=Paraburkholderia sp. TaxID=1926495 RepID=UPI00286EBCCF|nr:hypothetical protein [Paraburkholderia sp.]
MFNHARAAQPGGAQLPDMASLLPHHLASVSSFKPKAPRARIDQARATQRLSCVRMIVRVATHDAQLARRLLHAMLGEAMGAYTIDIDRRSELACLHVELERKRVPEAMALLIRTLPGAEFGTIKRLERDH